MGAPAIARRFGLLKTMVFSHLPSNVLLLLVPLMPTLQSAVAILLARNLLSQLDVPTRQSYSMAVVHPEERAASAAFSRFRATRVQPRAVVYGTYSGQSGLGLSFLLAGGLKIIYDLWIFSLSEICDRLKKAQLKLS